MSSHLDESPPPVAKGADEAENVPAPDGVRGSVVIAVAVAFTAVTACSVWVAWTIAALPAGEERAGRWGAPKANVQAIEMSLLPRSGDASARGAARADAPGDHGAGPAEASGEPRRREREAQQRLSSYGYSNRSRGMLHIPLARAKQLYLERERERARAAKREQPASRRAR